MVKASKKSYIFCAVAIVLILIGSIFSKAIDTNFGTVKTERLYLTNDNGYTVSAKLYIPDTAEKETPAPAMIICPGGDNPSDLSTPWASELARRGFIVALADYTGCGDTEVDGESQYWTNNGAMELDTIYDYLASRPFVDDSQIGVAGHSMGSLYSYRLSTKRPVSLVISDVLYTDALPEYDFDFVQISATHDEGLLARLENFEDIFSDKFLTDLFGTDKIEPGKLYGSWEENNARIFYTLNQTHADDLYSKNMIQLINDSAMKSMDAPDPLPVEDMIYGWNYAAMFLILAGIVILLFSTASILLDCGMFRSLKLSAPKVTAGFEYKSKGWWISAVILTLIPVIFFFPGTATGNKMQSTSLFQLGTTPNGYLIWSLFAACGMLPYFALVMLAGSVLKFDGDVSKGKKMVKSIILGSVIGLVGMLVLFIFHEVTLRLDGPFYTENFAHFYLLLLSNMIPQFTVASALAIFIKRKTNSIIPGIFIGGALIAYGLVSSNSIAMII